MHMIFDREKLECEYLVKNFNKDWSKVISDLVQHDYRELKWIV